MPKIKGWNKSTSTKTSIVYWYKSEYMLQIKKESPNSWSVNLFDANVESWVADRWFDNKQEALDWAYGYMREHPKGV